MAVTIIGVLLSPTSPLDDFFHRLVRRDAQLPSVRGQPSRPALLGAPREAGGVVSHAPAPAAIVRKALEAHLAEVLAVEHRHREVGRTEERGASRDVLRGEDCAASVVRLSHLEEAAGGCWHTRSADGCPRWSPIYD